MDDQRLLLTINYKLDAAQNFVSSIGDHIYYFFVSNHIDANNNIRPFNNEQDILVSSHQGMIFGKKIHSNDVSLMIRRVDWVANTVYHVYDHRDPDLYDKDFYAIVHEGTQWNVFKCLENGSGNPSTVAPSKDNVGATSQDFFYPNDGYRWKFMYSVTDADEDKFATTEYFPVGIDDNTRLNSTPGSLDSVIVESPGRGYGNYFDGSFGIGDIRLNGDPKKYAISTPGVKTTNGYYDGCWLYISSGPGAGQYRMIDSYISNSTYNYVTLESQFDPADSPQNGSIFEISPSISIVGDGREILSAVGRAIVNPVGNTIARIEMIERGLKYSHAMASVSASPVVGVTAQATITPMLSPFNGHGFNPEIELGSKYAGITVKLQGTEGNTIITDNDYSQMGIIKNPLFRDVEITLANQSRDFNVDEIVYGFTTNQLQGTIQTTTNANNELTDTLSVNGVNATQIVGTGDTIVINYASSYQMANVVSVTSSSIQMDTIALWNTGSNTANVFSAKVNSMGLITGFAAGSVILTNTTGNIKNGDRLIGAETGIYAEANVVTITSVNKTFDTFMGAHTYLGTIDQGSFIQDEVVYQLDNPSANARFHSSVADPLTNTFRIYTTNQFGNFVTAADASLTSSDQIKGATSGAIATLTNKYLPDLVYGSGEVTYIEYGDSISRAADNTETFKIVVSF